MTTNPESTAPDSTKLAQTEDDETTVLVVQGAVLLQGNSLAERNEYVKDTTTLTKWYLEQPDAVFDFNAHRRENARKQWQRKADAAAKRNQSVEPFDESAFPPQLHVKANSWLRLARLHDLDISIIEAGWP